MVAYFSYRSSAPSVENLRVTGMVSVLVALEISKVELFTQVPF